MNFRRFRLLLPVLALAAVLISQKSAHAAVITSFSFENSNYLNSDFGRSSTITTNFSQDSYDNAASGASGSRSALQLYNTDFFTGEANQNKYIQFGVSTQGYTGVSVDFSTRSFSTGFTGGQFQYSTNGTTFVNFSPNGTYTTSATYATKTFNLSSITGLNQNANAAFRIVFTGGTNSDELASNFVDNLRINGTVATPEPSTYAMMVLGLLALFTLNRRRKREEA